MKLVNLTPHAVNIVLEDGALNIVPSGVVARCSQSDVNVGTIDVDGIAVPLTETSFGDVVDLPAPAPDTLYIVSRLVATAANRDDLVVPNGIVRDDNGNIIGCKSLSH